MASFIKKVQAASKEENTFTVTTKNEYSARHVKTILKLFEYLGRLGCSRQVVIYWDGDGSDRIDLQMNGEEVKLPESANEDITEWSTILVLDDGYKKGKPVE